MTVAKVQTQLATQAGPVSAISATYPAATRKGNLLTARIGGQNMTNFATPTGWTLAEQGWIATTVGIFWKIADGTETTITFNTSIGTFDAAALRIDEWAVDVATQDLGNGSSGQTADSCYGGSTSATSTSVSPGSTNQAAELVLAVAMANGSRTSFSLNQGFTVDDNNVTVNSTRRFGSGSMVLAATQNLTTTTATWGGTAGPLGLAVASLKVNPQSSVAVPPQFRRALLRK